jgi:hypothetical protein
VGVARATDVAQQRDPVDGVAQRPVEAGFFAQPRGEQARAELRLERLSERVVLRQREGRDQLAETEWGTGNGEISRCMEAPKGR